MANEIRGPRIHGRGQLRANKFQDALFFLIVGIETIGVCEVRRFESAEPRAHESEGPEETHGSNVISRSTLRISRALSEHVIAAS